MLHTERARAFAERARSGKVCMGIHTSSMSPQMIELYGMVELDFIIIGHEVEALDLSRMEDLMRAANAANAVPIVKIKRPDPVLIGEVMNLGAPVVMVPHVTSKAQLELMVRASKFEPEGLRGECPVARYNGYGVLNLAETHDMAQVAHSIIPIIEDAEALDHIDEMMEVEDVDVFEVGPYDLSRSLGEKGQAYAGVKTMAALEKVCAAAARHGKAVLAPLWHTVKGDSYPAIYQRQMDELISRGVNCLYEIETVHMANHMTRLNVLRSVRAVEDDAPAPAPARAPAKKKSRGLVAAKTVKAKPSAKPASRRR